MESTDIQPVKAWLLPVLRPFKSTGHNSQTGRTPGSQHRRSFTRSPVKTPTPNPRVVRFEHQQSQLARAIHPKLPIDRGAEEEEEERGDDGGSDRESGPEAASDRPP
ncbi:hypothetical protein MPTK1_5g06920 [Marchantia polymorpha subsp. ruderalis]|uniref:Uncharacterized protein n=2 Tax=Marchantia polymorpha TaxID=3197 RepID=A0AAF6BFR4_MARPO|nr:hypothetical protein MARPO_0136s0030 [Marchantia polymorpha]BBN10848.1 hypothetical protein Mp_5g06920 [Marchantia polymorpha subsp. ruderalis]|eukprot:PTQ29703.1 hypothetical protein MARPO_0136s0030 [Marchantia polymorpha]